MIRLGLLTAIAGESMFLLGAPGCAKSMVSRRIKDAFAAPIKNEHNDEKEHDGIKYFEYLMNRFSTPEDIFGPYSLKALNGEHSKDGKEEYKRLTDNFLPTADIAFLDEIWKASPAIQNTLLTIINEKKFHNGNNVELVPLKALFAASNELPAKDLGLEALWDRFILRVCVNFIVDENLFFKMIDGGENEFCLTEEQKKLLITIDEFKSWKQEIVKIKLSDETENVITAIRKELKIYNSKNKLNEIIVSDRRWKKIAIILKTSAFLNCRSETDLMDCSLIEYCIWNTEEQRKKVREIIKKCIKQNGLNYDGDLSDIEEQVLKFKKAVDDEWFEEEYTLKEYKMNNDEMAYKLEKPLKIDSETISYISVDFVDRQNRKGAYFNSNKDICNNNRYYRENYFIISSKIEENKIEWTDGHSNQEFKSFLETDVKIKKRNYRSKYESFNEYFNDKHYKPIINNIAKKIQELKNHKQKNETPFKENLFADLQYCEEIFAKIDEVIKSLENLQIDMEKERERYAK